MCETSWRGARPLPKKPTRVDGRANPPISAQDTLTTGSKAVTTQTAILILATSPEAGSRVIHVPFSVVTSPLVMPWSKKNEPMEVVWTFLSNPAGTAGARMTSWTDITAVAAS